MSNRAELTGLIFKPAVFKLVGAKQTPLLDFSLAVDQPPPKEGQPRRGLFVPVKVWGALADEWSAYLSQARVKIGVRGFLSMDEWEDKDTGKKRSKIYVTAFELFDPKEGR